MNAKLLVPACACLIAMGDSSAAAERLRVPKGFTIERVAAAPLVERPMLASLDDEGRLFVCDSAGVNQRGPELTRNPPHRIRILSDRDGDGRFDQTNVFADKLVFPQGIAWHPAGVFVSSPPSFWRLRDTNGDGVADIRTELLTGFANTGVADDMHGATIGPDGRVYFFSGRFFHAIHPPKGPMVHQGTAPILIRCQLDGSEPEVVSGAQGNAVGVVFTPEGDMFASGTYLAPDSMGPGLRDAVIHCVDGAEYPVRDRILDEHRRTGELLPPLVHLGVAAASDLERYRGAAFGPEYRGNLLVALFNMHKVVRLILERDGATFRCRMEDFLVSSDPDFHPTDVLEDADGSLLVLDTGGWFRIGCPTSGIAKPTVLGGIYRVRRAGAAAGPDPRGRTIAWSTLSTDELANLLADPRFAVAERATRELGARGPAALGSIQRVLASAPVAETRMAATWAATRIAGDEARQAVRQALADRDAGVRQAAARAAGIGRDRPSVAALCRLVQSDSPPVRREAATSLGRIGDRSATPSLLAGLAPPANRFLEHAILFALIQLEDRPALVAGLKAGDPHIRRGCLIALSEASDRKVEPPWVVAALDDPDAAVRQGGRWVAARHPDLAPSLMGYFQKELARTNLDETQRADLASLLDAAARDPAFQALLAERVVDPRVPREQRLLLLETVARCPLDLLPIAWSDAIGQCLADRDLAIVRQAVATYRAAPKPPPPALRRIDAQIDVAVESGRWPGTNFREHYAIRWTGAIVIPKSGSHVLHLISDDGSRLIVDGQTAIDLDGIHGPSEKSATLRLTAGIHPLAVEYFQAKGGAVCRLLWDAEGKREPVPAAALVHVEPADPKTPRPGLVGEFFNLRSRNGAIPSLARIDLPSRLRAVALDESLDIELRASALAAIADQAAVADPALFALGLRCLDPSRPPLLRRTAAESLARMKLDAEQLERLAKAMATAGVLELGPLLAAFQETRDARIAERCWAALEHNPAAMGLPIGDLQQFLKRFPTLAERGKKLLSRFPADDAAKRARLQELSLGLSKGDAQRGRALFFGNKALCANCHAIGTNGGRIGPNLAGVGAIRAPIDLLEAIVFPSASFARGYEPHTLVLADGRVMNGIIARETADSLYVYDTQRLETRLPRSMVEEIRPAGISIMPSGLDSQLSREELADIITFLLAQKASGPGS